jgi:hypothetical protein
LDGAKSGQKGAGTYKEPRSGKAPWETGPHRKPGPIRITRTKQKEHLAQTKQPPEKTGTKPGTTKAYLLTPKAQLGTPDLDWNRIDQEKAKDLKI